MDMDPTTLCMDIENEPGQNTPEIDNETPDPVMATYSPPSGGYWPRWCGIVNEGRAASAQKHSDFLRRAFWKAYQAKRRKTYTGNYLEII